MRICSYREYGALATGLVLNDRVANLDDLNDSLGTDFGPDLDALLRRGQYDALVEALHERRAPRSGWKPGNLRYAPPVQRPRKILGVGLNFTTHARDLDAQPPEDPAAWMRPATTLAGADAELRLPEGIGTVTAEAEIAIVLGQEARRLETREQAREAVFGFMPVLDLTAEDLLRKNPRNLTRAKSYDGFCVTGPFVITKDEWEPTPRTRIVTEVDGQRKEGRVEQMRHDPYELVRFFSHVFPWEPGDVLLTGTPGAIALRAGCTVRASIEGLDDLQARVVE